MHHPGMARWFKLTSKSLPWQAFQLTPALSTGSPRGMARCRTTPQTPQKNQQPPAVLCREASGRYSPPQAKCRFSTNRGLRCVVGVRKVTAFDQSSVARIGRRVCGFGLFCSVLFWFGLFCVVLVCSVLLCCVRFCVVLLCLSLIHI